MTKALLSLQSLLVVALLLSACATKIQKSLENETGEIWNCDEGLFFDEFYAVYNEASNTGYVFFQPIGYKSNFQKVQLKPGKVFAESVTAGFEERNWILPNGRLRIWNDGSEPDFAGTLLLSVEDSSGFIPIEMRCGRNQ